MLEDRFLLLGHNDGVLLVDMKNTSYKPTIIIPIRVRQMIVVDTCRAILMLAGRYKQVRCYSYDALLKMIYGILELDWDQRQQLQFDVPSYQEWERIASQSGRAPNQEQSDSSAGSSALTSEAEQSNMNGFSLSFKERLAKKKEERAASPFSPEHLATALSKSSKKKDMLSDYYYKFPETREASCLQTYQTNTYVFVSVQHKDKIVLWQRKRDQPLRPFYRLKVFWIPMEPRFMTFADDRCALRHIIAVFQNEATVIELRDSKVQTIPIDPELERIYQTNWVRDQFEHQLSSPRSPHSPIPLEFPTLPVNLSAPPIQWNSMMQLPFYPDSLPATTLTTEFSIPPSYNTVVTSLDASAPPDPVALPSTSAPQLFLATLSKQSYIIDLSGALFSTQVFRWSEPPNHIEFIQFDDDWCVVGFGPETVELIHMKTAETVERIMHGVPVKFLGRWDTHHPDKKKSTFRSIFWSCAANNERVHVYMLKAS